METVEGLGIGVVSLSVHFGDESYLDGVEMTSDEFLARLSTARQMPKTSAPSVDAFRREFEAVGDADGVLCITISGKLSGTYNAATRAAEQVSRFPVTVLDSGSASMGIGFPAIAAAEAGRRGASLQEAEQVAREVIARTDILFYADTLEFLQRNGRIGRAASLVGSILEIKPVLTVANGEVEQYQRTRTRGKAIQALVDWTRQRERERVAVIWSTGERELERLLDGLAPAIPREQVVVTKYGPVLGAHIGPGAMGVIAVDARGDGA
jgi:DegV family protein with EDD domain